MNPTNTTLIRVDGAAPARSLADALAGIDRHAEGTELHLDFSGLHRVDGAAVRSLAAMVDAAGARSISLTARAVPIEVYKVFKLAGLAHRLTFR